jgi:hypothetical protein
VIIVCVYIYSLLSQKKKRCHTEPLQTAYHGRLISISTLSGGMTPLSIKGDDKT